MAGAKIKPFAIEDVSIDLHTVMYFVSMFEATDHEHFSNVLRLAAFLPRSCLRLFILWIFHISGRLSFTEIARVWTMDFTISPLAYVEDIQSMLNQGIFTLGVTNTSPTL